MTRPYQVTISVRNTDKGKTDRTELVLPIQQGEDSNTVANAVSTAMKATPIAAPTPQSEHDRLVALQNAVTLLLLNDPRLSNTPVVPEFKFQMESDQQVDILWQMPRSSFTVTPDHILVAPGNSGGNNAQTPSTQNLVGAGILVEMPEMETDSNNVTGPPGHWNVNIVCFEERNVNLTDGIGTEPAR